MVSWKLAAEMKLSDWTAALVMPEELGRGRRRLGADPLGLALALALDAEVLRVEVVAGDDVPLAEVGVAGVLDLDAVHQVMVLPAELELVDDRAGEQAGVADGVDADLAEHLGDDDFEVLVVDLDALGAIDVLDLALSR